MDSNNAAFVGIAADDLELVEPRAGFLANRMAAVGYEPLRNTTEPTDEAGVVSWALTAAIDPTLIREWAELDEASFDEACDRAFSDRGLYRNLLSSAPPDWRTEMPAAKANRGTIGGGVLAARNGEMSVILA